MSKKVNYQIIDNGNVRCQIPFDPLMLASAEQDIPKKINLKKLTISLITNYLQEFEFSPEMLLEFTDTESFCDDLVFLNKLKVKRNFLGLDSFHDQLIRIDSATLFYFSGTARYKKNALMNSVELHEILFAKDILDFKNFVKDHLMTCQNNQIKKYVVELDQGKFKEVTFGAPTVEQNLKKLKKSIELQKSTQLNQISDLWAEPGWGISVVALEKLSHGDDRRVIYKYARLQLPDMVLQAREYISIVTNWIDEVGALAIPDLKCIYFCIPAGALAMGLKVEFSAVNQKLSNQSFAIDPFVFGWNPCLSFINFLHDDLEPALFFYLAKPTEIFLAVR